MICRLLVVLMMNPPLLTDKSEVVERLDEAAAVFGETMSVPDKAIPQELLDRLTVRLSFRA